MKKYFINGLLVFFSLAFGLVLAEEIYSRVEPPDQRNQFLGERSIYMYDPQLGMRLRPSSVNITAASEFRVEISINKQGMRYREIGPKSGFRVAVLGDSFAFGHGVKQRQRFTDIVEENLGIEMLNFAADGYGPVQYYLQLDEVLPFSPDLVMVTVCLANDLSDGISNNLKGKYFKPYAELDASGNMVVKGIPVPNWRTENRPYYFIIRYALGRLLFSVAGDWLPQKLDALRAALFIPPYKPPPLLGMSDFDRHRIYSHPKSEDVQKAMQVNEAIYRGIRDKLREHHVPLVFFVTMTDADFDNKNAIKLFEAMAKKLDIPVIRSHKDYDKTYYYAKDRHWNSVGHAKAAEQLTEAMKAYIGHTP